MFKLQLKNAPIQDLRQYVDLFLKEVFHIEVTLKLDNGKPVITSFYSHNKEYYYFLQSVSLLIEELDEPKFATEEDFAQWIYKQENLVDLDQGAFWSGYLIQLETIVYDDDDDDSDDEEDDDSDDEEDDYDEVPI